jgi:hypothetical protein
VKAAPKRRTPPPVIRHATVRYVPAPLAQVEPALAWLRNHLSKEPTHA